MLDALLLLPQQSVLQHLLTPGSGQITTGKFWFSFPNQCMTTFLANSATKQVRLFKHYVNKEKPLQFTCIQCLPPLWDILTITLQQSKH